ncbi:MAG TPA: hypothetical protein VM686_08355 [Polyangiaceae bacterium]|jgi:hypothetical protein|nr:hypothetical protein [Polyangiaceae bacterium]
MRREKRLTKREKKAQTPGGGGHAHDAQHIHCVACGRHIDPDEFGASPPNAVFLRCEHGSRFPACTGCQDRGRQLLAEHDRTGRPVAAASAWH